MGLPALWSERSLGDMAEAPDGFTGFATFNQVKEKRRTAGANNPFRPYDTVGSAKGFGKGRRGAAHPSTPPGSSGAHGRSESTPALRAGSAGFAESSPPPSYRATASGLAAEVSSTCESGALPMLRK